MSLKAATKKIGIPRPVRLSNYIEDFDKRQGGWWGWNGNRDGFRALEMSEDAVVSRSPWWIDYNHAPPGAGYLHMIFCLNTKGPFSEAIVEAAGPNRFVTGGFSRNLANAKFTLSLKGEVLLRGASLNLLVQASDGTVTSGWVLKEKPLKITRGWSRQTITVTPDEREWICLGGRHDRRDYYSYLPLQKVLSDVNVNIMFILFPLKIQPMGSIRGHRDLLRPGKDYPIWTSELPEGYIMMDRISISYPPR